MHIPVSEAESRLADLLNRVEAGEQVILTRHGRDVAQIVSTARILTRDERVAALDRAIPMAEPEPGLTVPRSH